MEDEEKDKIRKMDNRVVVRRIHEVAVVVAAAEEGG